MSNTVTKSTTVISASKVAKRLWEEGLNVDVIVQRLLRRNVFVNQSMVTRMLENTGCDENNFGVLRRKKIYKNDVKPSFSTTKKRGLCIHSSLASRHSLQINVCRTPTAKVGRGEHALYCDKHLHKLTEFLQERGYEISFCAPSSGAQISG